MNNHSDAPNMQSYPSPTAHPADNGGPFYASSQGQPSANMSTPEELQLAAQLSRNMAPNMGNSSGMEGISQDMRGQQGISNQYQPEPQGHNLHDPQQQQQMHHQSAPAAAMAQMGAQYNGSPLPDAPGSNRKRSKVSRACDECRRKKIRCDASEESGEGVQCSNCKRVGSQCLFSRVPQKRGPSKGYIKELADRLNTLETTLHGGEISQHLPQESPYQQQPQRRPSEEYSPIPMQNEQPRKRSFSSFSNDLNPAYQTPRAAPGWSNQDGRHTYQQPVPSGTPQEFREANYSPGGVQSGGPWSNAPEAARRLSISAQNAPQADMMRNPIDATMVQDYYDIIHPTFPILSPSDLDSIAKFASPADRYSFNNSLINAIQSFPSDPTQPRQANPIPVAKPGNAKYNSRSAELTRLQSLMFQIIAAGNLDPSDARRHTKSSPSTLLGSAVGFAYSMKLHVHKAMDSIMQADPDSDEHHERRLWWILIVMDKWHAASTSSPVFIPDTSIVIYPDEDPTILGETLYHLSRMSVVLGHLSLVALIQPSDMPPMAAPVASALGTLSRGELERIREDLPASFFPPSSCPWIHFCYWSLRILVELRNPDSDPAQGLLDPALNLVTQLTFNRAFVGPLTHYASTLVVLALIELLKYDRTKAEATTALKSLYTAGSAPSAFDPVSRALIAKKVPSLVSSTTGEAPMTDSQNLQHLAELATGQAEKGKVANEATTTAPNIFKHYSSLRDIIHKGWMNALLESVNTGI
ncbi:hypothetical protein BP6252_06218 [Coleophoma cylindrospora]|uniref:Zn(2)-C6 fungal-type domain-containing protein n=1 Tax=Coleophoma cylindrospora TaxID=1849047 RepID=A0A3D8RMB0_9HELO|nr:hypothetical protein BP6252_06218 [Coleophoma cylindrospora]